MTFQEMNEQLQIAQAEYEKAVHAEKAAIDKKDKAEFKAPGIRVWSEKVVSSRAR